MTFDANLQRVAKVAALLEETTDPTEFAVAMQEINANPELMGSLVAMQFVRDAVRGNPTPDLRYTEAIMQYIADAEAKPAADEKNDE